MNRDLIEQYAADAPKLAASFAGLSSGQLGALPVPGTWSIRQIVLHVLDSDLIGSDRMKRIAAEDNPTLIGYDESAFSRTLYFDELDLGLACEIFEKNRQLTAQILRRLPETAFARKGTHNERGIVTLVGLLEDYVQHLHHHLKFIEQKRKLVAK